MHLPIKTHEIDVRMALEGESLSTLSPLFGRDLPPLGPYRLEGLLALYESDYSLRNIDLTLGESDIQGGNRLPPGRGKANLYRRPHKRPNQL